MNEVGTSDDARRRETEAWTIHAVHTLVCTQSCHLAIVRRGGDANTYQYSVCICLASILCSTKCDLYGEHNHIIVPYR
ncbi:hypothetical protein G7K_1353-t1 [Saitoella complicata NRRL Y-17804]|uniref:Uncharacterized protein n=1 Tax=Saitoella complicata (strain BCRC 22490 / CBS 7301 / JCM 7358 / NBRC 10748 / NRRL Y-17804) TaxID=698492 RepID=A0A0E9NB90_SAICN|nr:hypothetical protein G7K_1353-t1 [Saitoella complicata NRRL Y-17804]